MDNVCPSQQRTYGLDFYSIDLDDRKRILYRVQICLVLDVIKSVRRNKERTIIFP